MTQKELVQTVDSVCCSDFIIDYVAVGRGRKPLVILPGMSVKPVIGSAEAVANAYAAFAEEYRVFLFDYRRELPPGFTVREMAGDVASAMRRLGIREAAVLGVSLGGMVAQQLAADEPELVGTLMLGSTLARHTKKTHRVFEEWANLARAGDRQRLQNAITGRVYSPAYVKTYRAAFDMLAESFTPEEMERYAWLCEACMGFSAYDELGAIRCPVLVMGSWRDRTLFPEGSMTLAKRLKCDLYLYAGYSHAVYDEAPDYRRRLTDFLQNEQ